MLILVHKRNLPALRNWKTGTVHPITIQIILVVIDTILFGNICVCGQYALETFLSHKLFRMYKCTADWYGLQYSRFHCRLVGNASCVLRQTNCTYENNGDDDTTKENTYPPAFLEFLNWKHRVEPFLDVSR